VLHHPSAPRRAPASKAPPPGPGAGVDAHRQADRRSRMPRARIACFVAALLLLACDVSEHMPSRALPPSVAQALAARRVPAYAPNLPTPREIAKADADDLARVFESALPPELRRLVKRDSTLDAVAQAAAWVYLETEAAPAPPITQWLHWKAGST